MTGVNRWPICFLKGCFVCGIQLSSGKQDQSASACQGLQGLLTSVTAFLWKETVSESVGTGLNGPVVFPRG